MLLSRAMMPLLMVQFLVGMYVSLFTVFPAPSSAANPLEQIFTGGLLLLTVHVAVGFIILLTGVALLALGTFLKKRRILLFVSFGLAAILTSISTGLAFVIGAGRNRQQPAIPVRPNRRQHELSPETCMTFYLSIECEAASLSSQSNA